MRSLTESMNLDTVLAPQDVSAGEIGSYLDVRDTRRFAVLVRPQAVPYATTVTVQLKQAKDEDGTAAKNLGDAVEVDLDADEDPEDVVIEMQNTDLDWRNGFTHVSVSVTSDGHDTAVDGRQCIVTPQDVGTADVTGSWVDVSAWGSFRIVAKAGAVTAGKILTLQCRQATDNSGTGAKNLGTAATAAGSGGAAPADVEKAFDHDDRDEGGGFDFVTAVLGIDENAKLGAAWIIREDGPPVAGAWLLRGDRTHNP